MKEGWVTREIFKKPIVDFNEIRRKHPDYSKCYGGVYGKYGTNCHSYALYVLSQLTGKKVATAGCNFKRFNKNELWNVSAGDLIRYKSPDNNKDWGHTVIVVSANGNAINITDCNSDNKSTVRWRTIYISEIEKLFYANGNNYVIKFADWFK